MGRHSTRYPAEVRDRAVRLVFEHRGEYGPQWEATCSIAAKFGCTSETLRRWVRQAERDSGASPPGDRASCTAATTASNTRRSNTPSAWPKPESILQSAASATATTTRWPKRSTASTRSRRSAGAAHGDRSRPSNTPPSLGSTGSIIATCSAPSATSRPQRPKQITMPPAKTSIWLIIQTKLPPGKPGRFRTLRTALVAVRTGDGMRPVIELCLRLQQAIHFYADR